MYNRFYLTLAVLLAMQMHVSTQTLPNWSELSAAAPSELTDLLNIAFENSKQDYGFNDLDQPDQVTVGNPFTLYVIPEKLIPHLRSCSSILEMVEKDFLNKMVRSLLYVQGRPTCLVGYHEQEDGYHVGRLSSTDLIINFHNVVSQATNPIFISSYVKPTWYFSEETDGYLQLHSLENVSQNGLNKSLSESKSIYHFIDEIETLSSQGGN